MATRCPHRGLIALGLAQTAIYAAIAGLSSRFAHGRSDVDRPILSVVALLFGGFALYLASLRAALRGSSGSDAAGRRRTMGLIVGFALMFRLILWWSQPILEVDFYRYLWDGRVLAAGVSPYKYSPADVQHWGQQPDAPAELRQLEDLRRQAPALATIFSRIHYPQIPTVYPPAAQWVFAAAACVTPPGATLETQVRALKALLLFFDVGNIWLLLVLLHRTNRPPGWVLAYAWCPLVLKEFANTGRPDSIAVFFLLVAMNALQKTTATKTPAPRSPSACSGKHQMLLWSSMAAVAWGIATLAKLYPLVLLPLLARWWLRRLGVHCLVPLALYGGALAAFAWPFWQPMPEPLAARTETNRPVVRLVDAPAQPATHGVIAGLGTFLAHWEMNDWLFAVVHENLRPPGEETAAWFAVTPVRWRRALHGTVGEWLEARGWQERIEPAFLVAKLVMYAITAAVLLALALKPWPMPTDDEAGELLRRAFWSLAWFWLLSPTQNPWYWIWALAFLPFAGRGWQIAAGCVLGYYLRFWFDAHFPDGTVVWPTPYAGWQFFDYVVVWFEQVPILLAVGWTAWHRR